MCRFLNRTIGNGCVGRLALGLLGGFLLSCAIAEEGLGLHTHSSAPALSDMDHEKMGRDNLDHSTMNHGGSEGEPGTTSRTPIPPVTNADRAAVYKGAEGHVVHDTVNYWYLLLDQLEWRDSDEGSALGWDVSGWIGGDINRLWLRSEGEDTNNQTDEAEIQLLWGHSVGPWWDLVTGVRQDFEPGAPQTWSVIGLQGLALYGLEAEASAFIGEDGQTAARMAGDYDTLITNRLILQSTAELNFYGKNDFQRGVGSGLSNLELGLRLRYEIRREFAPYIGVIWTHSYGNTAELIRTQDGNVSDLQVAAGIRVWF